MKTRDHPALRLRLDRAVGESPRRRNAARDRRAGHDHHQLRRPAARRGPHHGRRLHGVRGRAGVVRDDLGTVASCGRQSPSIPTTRSSSPSASGPTWAGECSTRGEWREAVIRSVLTLKALTYRPTGGIVAAPTTSLPEQIGGVRNWDYRYCWLRDATLTLLALMDAGYFREAAAWRDWLLRAAAGSPDQVQIMYGLSGERHAPRVGSPLAAGI